MLCVGKAGQKSKIFVRLSPHMTQKQLFRPALPTHDAEATFFVRLCSYMMTNGRRRLFLLAADHAQGLFAQGALASRAHVKTLFFAVAQFAGGEVEITDSTAPALLLAGYLAIAGKEFAQ